jgi:WD40 repeat protein
VLAGVLTARGQEDFTHPELTWKTIETAHFFVHFHDGAERTAQVIAKIAEDVYTPVTSLYNHVPTQKVSFIVNDVDDISNGAAYFFDNKIVIYAPSMDFELRGTHNWLRNVVTHEFTHIVQIQTSMKFGRQLPSFYFQWLGYESERRQDVLYGYPNTIVSYPISGFVVPAWFAEGVAQYNRNDLRYDFWDTHRDMILRSYALDGNMLTWEQMGVFGKTSLGNESSYNSGFAFVSYIARKYGEEKIAEISRNLSRLTEVTIGGAIGRALGTSGDRVYEEWKEEIRKEYATRTAKVVANLRAGEMMRFDSTESVFDPDARGGIESMIVGRPTSLPAGAIQEPCCRFNDHTGFGNLYPSFSPDGKKLAYVSTKGGDYFVLSSLFVYDFASGKETLVQPGVRNAPAWSPDGTKLYYAKNTRENPHWSLQFDVYEYTIATEDERRITKGRRAMTPVVSPDGKKIAYVVNADGTTNLAVANVDGSGHHVITPYANGEQVYNPQWSPSGDRLIFDYSVRDGRDIAEVRPDGSGLRFLVEGDDDARTGVFTPDGARILFSSDRTGIFNLYYYTVGNGAIEQVTNVVGGAFCPTVDRGGDIVYSGYTSGGYKIFSLKNGGTLPAGDNSYVRGGGAPGNVAPATAASTPQFDWSALRAYDDTRLSPLQAKPYRSIFTSLTIVPFIRVDNYNTRNNALDVIKPGVYLFSNDVLEKTGFFAGAAINRQLERDLFLQFFYRSRIPLLYEIGLEPVASFEIYNVTRKTDNSISLPASTIPVNVTYNMLEFDLALTQPFVSQFSTLEFRYAHSRYTSIIDNFFNPETDPPSLVTGSSDLYLIANTLFLTLKSDAVVPARTMEINPTGRRITLRIGRELNKFNGDGQYEVTATGLQPLYKTVNFTRLELNWREFIPFLFKNHTLTVALRGGTIPEHSVDEFFDFYAGGLVGMKGYPFYAIGGNEMAVAGLNYRFPISNSLDIRIFQLYFDKLYASVFVDAGDAWTSDRPALKEWKTDAGAELRLESFSFYSYPTRIFFSAAYGFNQFDRYIRSRNETVTYGKEWRFYFGVLFGFDFD